MSTGRRMRALLAVLCCVVVAGQAWSAQEPPVLEGLPSGPEGLIDRCRFDPSLSNYARHSEVLTGGMQIMLLGENVPIGPRPHVDWARPYYRGKVKVLAFVTATNYSDIAALYRCLDCDLSVVQMPPGRWFEKIRDQMYEGFSARVAREALSKPVDVIFLCSGPWSGPQHLPEDITEMILEKVRSGTGLVINGCHEPGGGHPGAFWPAKTPYAEICLTTQAAGPVRLNPLGFTVVRKGIVDGIPFALLPPVFALPLKVEPGGTMVLNGGKTPPRYRYTGKPEPLPDILEEGTDTPLVVVGEYGKGKVVSTGWACNTGFPVVDANDRRHGIDRYEEYFAGMIAKLVLWAAGKESDVAVEIRGPANATPDRTDVELALENNSKSRLDLGLEARLHDMHFREVWRGEERVSLNAGAKGAVAFRVSSVPSGRYAFDVIARTADGASANWASTELVITAPEKLEVATDKESYKRGETAKITGKAAGLGGGEYAVDVRITDSLGRLVAEQRAALAADGTFQLSHRLKDAMVSIHHVEAVLRKGDKPRAKAEAYFYCPKIGWDDFHNIVWGWEQHIPTLRDWAGVDTYLVGGWPGHEYLARSASANGLGILWTNVAPQNPEQTQKEPEKAETAYDEQVERVAGWVNRYGAIGLCFQDERHSFKDPEPNEECLRRFRKWLKGQYGTLDRLNASWETAYKSWDEVKPLHTEDFKPDRMNLAPWLDFRLFVSKLTIDIDARHSRTLRKATDPNLYIGIEGIFGLGGHMVPYSGFDYAEHARRCFTMIMPYDDEKNSVTNLARSFCPGPLSAWDGYSAPKWRYYSKPWWGALHGYWAMSWFCSRTFATSTGCLFPQALWVEEATRKLRRGAGKLLMTSKMEEPPIVFLYSQPSIYAAWIAGRWVNPRDTHMMNRPSTQRGRENLQRLVNEFCLQYSYVDETAIQEGALKGKKLLVLPDSMCMSKKTAEAIEQFVRDGGVVLADLCPALWDEHGHPVKPGYLDELFGVTRDKFEYGTRPWDYLIGTFEDDPEFHANNEWFIGEYYEKSLKVAGGKALGKHIFLERDVPAFVINRTGKGATVLMNFLETHYSRYPEGRQRVFMRALLDLAKIERPMQVVSETGAQLYQYDLTRFTDGENLYVGVYRMTISSALNPDEVIVRLPKSGHLYEVKSEKYLGKGKEARVNLPAAGSALIAILPYKIEGVSVKASSARAGEQVRIAASVKASARPGRHVLHLEIYDPEGNLYRAYTSNAVAQNGKWEGYIPTALNDLPGRWKVKVKEVVSGLSAQTEFRLGK